MLDIRAHIDREKDVSGTVMIHAKGSLPGICSDIEIIVANIVKGLAKQMLEDPKHCDQAAVLFAIAASEGAKRGLREYKEKQ